MSGMQRRKGRRYELAALEHLINAGAVVVDVNRSGFDGHDLELPEHHLQIECKDQKTMNLAGWCDQASAQADGRPWVVLHKRPRQTDVGRHYVTTTLDTLLQILNQQKDTQP